MAYETPCVRIRRPLPLAFACAILLGATGGCNTAKEAMRADFTDFNAILQSTETRQMLLNLVRMHYREAPLFMQAGSLTAAYENTVSTRADGSLEQGDSSFIGAGATFTFASKPTISYTPIAGKEYVQQFMTEITPQTFTMLVDAQWPVNKLGKLLIEEITLDSGDVLVGRPEHPSYERFCEFLETLKAADATHELQAVWRKDGGIDLSTGTLKVGIETIRFRSLFATMFLAARDIRTPAGREGWVKVKKGWDILDVGLSERPPANALVSVEYGGWYYSIANDDVASKDTLALLLQLARIQAGPSAPAPLITIPAR